MPITYNVYKSAPKGSVKTYTRYRSVVAADLGLTIANIVASVVEGDSVSIESQTFSTNKIDFQVNFSTAGKSIVRITTTFDSSSEQHVEDILFQTLDNTIPFTDYV